MILPRRIGESNGETIPGDCRLQIADRANLVGIKDDFRLRAV